MSNKVLTQTAIFVRNLLVISETQIKIGRVNWDIADMTTSYIAIDTVSPATRVSLGDHFDSDNDNEIYYEEWQTPIIISFYGDDAYTNANKFRLSLRSENSRVLQESLSLAVYAATSLIDIKNLTGTKFNNRLDLSLNVNYTTQLSVEAESLLEAQTEVLNNK